jgi:hypothetical protein
LYESWDNRLDYPPTKIPERYLRGELAVIIELSVLFSGQRLAYSAHATVNLNSKISRESFEQTTSAEENEFAMLVGNVHVVDDQERAESRTDTLIRLKLLDEVKRVGIQNSLYLSVISGEFVFRGWPRLKDREFDVSRVRGSAIGIVRQFPNDVIQAGPEVVDNFSSKNAESQRNLQRLMVMDSLRVLLVVELWEDWVFAFLKEPGDLGLKIEDVLLGPF